MSDQAAGESAGESAQVDIARAKRALRARLRARRGRRDAGERAQEGQGLAGHLDLTGLTVAGYLATVAEPDVGPLLAPAGQVLLPVPRDDRTLDWVRWDGTRAAHPRLPVDVPVGPVLGVGAAALLAESVAVLLVPALAVDRAGWRLGQGGGYYDRLLAGLAGHEAAVRVVAVVHDDELLDSGIIPHDPFDRRVNWALTPHGLYRLAR